MLPALSRLGTISKIRASQGVTEGAPLAQLIGACVAVHPLESRILLSEFDMLALQPRLFVHKLKKTRKIKECFIIRLLN